MDIDEGAEVSIGVNGTEKVSRGYIKGNYRIKRIDLRILRTRASHEMFIL